MTILLYLLAFPGLPMIASALWLRASRRYEAHMQRVASYPDPSIDDVVDKGLFPVYRKLSRAQAEMDAAARSGSLGPEAQQLQRIERRSFYLVGLMIPVGMGVAIFLGWLSAPRETDIEVNALVIAYVGALALIGAVCAWSAFTSMRAGKRSLALRYLLGITALAVGGYIGFVELLGRS